MDSLSEREVALEALMPLILEALAAGQTVQFLPKGTSMLPMLRQDLDRVVLGPVPERLRKYDIPLYRRSSGQYVLHRIVRCGGTLSCVGDNQFLRESVSRDQVLAVVVGFRRGGRYYRTTSLPYRVYCRMWHWSRPVRRIWRKIKLIKKW